MSGFKMSIKKGAVTALIAGVFVLPELASAQSYASPERSAAAIGHYARARALLVEALAEFERGREVARPDVLIDPEEWRLSVISRTEELNRILDPQPRVTRSGVRFSASKSLIRRDSERTPVSGYVAQDSNTQGERRRAAAIKKTVSVQPKKESTPADSVANQSEQFHGVISKSADTETVEQQNIKAQIEAQAPEKKALSALREEETVAPTAPPAVEASADKPSADIEKKSEVSTSTEATGASQEDLEISRAIEQAIKARLEKVNAGSSPSAGSGEPTGVGSLAPKDADPVVKNE